MVTSLSVGATVLSVVERVAWERRERMPLGCASDAPFAKVAPNVNGPNGELLPATWKEIAVLAGVDAFQTIVPHVGGLPGAGFASLMDEISVPDGVKPVCT